LLLGGHVENAARVNVDAFLYHALLEVKRLGFLFDGVKGSLLTLKARLFDTCLLGFLARTFSFLLAALLIGAASLLHTHVFFLALVDDLLAAKHLLVRLVNVLENSSGPCSALLGEEMSAALVFEERTHRVEATAHVREQMASSVLLHKVFAKVDTVGHVVDTNRVHINLTALYSLDDNVFDLKKGLVQWLQEALKRVEAY